VKNMINTDWRNMENGMRIPTEAGYCDQPSIVKTKSGIWVCSVTTGKGGEGAKGQYVNITRSFDKGHTWTHPIALEGIEWESAYSSLTIAPSGRIYCFYCYNLDHIDIEQAHLVRYDMGGYYCYRYSEDDGVTWSDRFVVPIRDFSIDEEQEVKTFEGKQLRFFWNVSRVFFDGDTFYSAITKYHYKHTDVLYSSEGVLLRCRNLDKDPEHAVWETLPDGKTGIRTPDGGGRVAEEHSYVLLSDGTIFATFRTIDGYSCRAISRDGGHNFEPTDYLRYTDGRPVKHNRAATFLWPLGNGKYLYWFNNHGKKTYQRRNPIWCLIGMETPTPTGLSLTFSEPELLLYHDSEYVAMSYPDLLCDGDWYITETQKVEARIHRIDSRFIEKLLYPSIPTIAPVWKMGDTVIPQIRFSEPSHRAGNDQRLLTGNGLTVFIAFRHTHPGEVLLSNETPDGGIRISVNEEGFLEAEIGDIMASSILHGSIQVADGKPHKVALIVDAQAKILYFVTDDRMDDGNDRLTCGWRWLNRSIQEIPSGRVSISASVKEAMVFDKALLTSEVNHLSLKKG
jgi:ribosomal protein L37AE/L43A